MNQIILALKPQKLLACWLKRQSTTMFVVTAISMIIVFFIVKCDDTLPSMWTLAPRPMFERLALSQVGYNANTSMLYIFGGFNDHQPAYSQCNNRVWKWNVSNASSNWLNVSEHTPTQCFFSEMQNSVQIGNVVWFVGINNGTYNEAKVYAFDLMQEKFIPSKMTNVKYPSSTGCVASNETHIFMLGGYSESSKMYYPYLQFWDIATGKPYKLNYPPADIGLGHQFCICVNNSLYVFGGDE